MLSPVFLLFFCREIHCQAVDENTTSPMATAIPTTTAATTTTSYLYCAADKCDRHSLFIYDLEQKVNNLTRGFEILHNHVEKLEEENLQLKTENEVLREDVKELQGLGNACKQYKLYLYSFRI